MTRHLLKLVWRRKRVHGLLVVEIFASFLVLFAVAAAGIYFGGNWMRPLGYDWHDVWVVDLMPDGSMKDPEVAARQTREFLSLLTEAREYPGVVAAAGASSSPYHTSTWTNTTDLKSGGTVTMHMSWAGDGFFEVMRMPLVAGRAFAPEDAALDWIPLVIDRELAHDLFGTEDPIGKSPPYSEDSEPERFRIVGVVDDYRKDGELAGPTNFCFRLLDPDSKDPERFQQLVLRTAGTPPAGFEQQLLERLRRIAPSWSFDIHAMADVRSARLRGQLAPLSTCVAVAIFLLLMVALGLVGVMWQNVTQRTREIGLRRATGASAAAIRRQVLLEMLLMAGFGVAFGVTVVLQLPILGWFPVLDGGLVGSGLLAATLLIAALTVLCGVYPSHLATAVHPAEALHYE